MKDDPRHQLTLNQATFTLFGAIVGIGIITLPREAARAAEQDAWIAVTLGALLPIAAIVFMVWLGRRFPHLTLVEVMEHTLGRYLGKGLGLLFVVYEIVLSAIVLNTFCFMLKAYLLPNTPNAVVIGTLLLLAVYLASSGFKIIGRINELYFYLLILLYVFLLPPLTVAEPLNLLPVGGVGISKILQGSLVSAFAYSGFEMFAVIYPFIQRQERALRAGIKGILIIIPFFIIPIIICIMVFGPELLKSIYWPTLVALKIQTFPVIERGELLFLIIGIGGVVLVVANHLFAAGFSFARLWGFTEHKYVVAASIPFTFVLALLPRDILEASKYADLIGRAGCALGIGLPVFLLVIAILLRKREC